MAAYQQKCMVCRKNRVLVKNWRQKPICDACRARSSNVDLSQEIKDPEMKKFFDIDPALYEKSSFLRDIKRQYILNEMLTEKQRTTFEKVAKELEKESTEDTS